MNLTPRAPKNPAPRLFAIASVFLAGLWNSSAANVTLTASDPGGSSSFNSAGNWNNGQAPSAGNSYFTANFVLRTPAPTTSGNNYIFGGDSLSVDSGARFLGKVGNNVAGNTTSATITVANLILNGGVFEQADVNNDNSALTVAGNVTINAPTVVGALGAPSNGGASFEVLEFTAAISGSAKLQISGTAVNSGQDTGVVKLSAANPYSGTLTVTNGNSGSTAVIASSVNRALQLNHLNAVQSATLNLTAVVNNPLSFASGANSGPFNVGALIGSSAQTLTDTAGAPVTLSVGGINASGTYAGALTGAGALTKVGNGVFTLAGTNTFSGVTAVGGGVLALAATGSISNSAVIAVAGGATLDVSANAFTLWGNQSLMGGGTNRGSVSVASGARVYAGADGAYGTNVFTGNLAFASGATAGLDLGPAWNGANDQIVVGGNLTLNNTVFHLKAPDGSANLDTGADYTLLTVAGTITGTAASTPVWEIAPQNAANFSIMQSGSSLKLHYAPAAPPAGTLALSPDTAAHNQSVLVSATVTSSSHPISTVMLDASSIGGPSALPLVAAGGNVYTNRIAAGAAVSLGVKTFVATITDNSGLIGTTPDGTLNVVASSPVWNGGGADNNWSSNPNWAGGAAPGYAGDSVTFSGSARLTPNMEAGYSVGGLAFDGSAGSFILGGAGGALTLNGGGIVNNSASGQILNVPLINVGPQTFGAQSGDLTFGQTITNGGQLLTVDGNANTTLNGGLSGDGGLDKEDGGTLTLNGTNTFTGGILIGSGTLVVGGAGVLGGSNYPGNITNFGTFIYSSSADQTIAGSFSMLGLTKSGPATLTLSGNNTYLGDTIISGGVLRLGGSGTLGGGAYGGNISDDGVFQFSSSASQTLSGSVSGSGAVVVDGAGTLTFNAANNYSGATTVRGGVLVLNPASVGYASFGDLAVSNAALTVNAGGNSSVTVSALTLNSNAALNLNYDFSSGNPSSAAISAATLSAPGARITINVGGVAPAVGQFPLVRYAGGTLPGIANFSLGVRPPGATAVLVNNSANRSIDLSVTAVSPAVWVPLIASDAFGSSSFLSGANWQDGNLPGSAQGYYTKNFSLRTPADANAYTFGGGALSIDVGGRLMQKGQNGQTITVANLILNGGVADYANLNSDNFTQTLAGNITLQAGLTSYLGALGGAGVAETLSVNAAIGGSGNLQIGGPQVNVGQDVGNVVLGGANTYTGATTVASGVLVVNGSLAGTPLTVGANSTLAGLGTLAGPVVVQPSGHLAPGQPANGALTATIGTLSVNNTVTLGGSIQLRINRGASPSSDRLAAASVAVSSGASLTVNNLGSTNLAAGDTFTLFSVPVSGTFASVALPLLPSTNLVWTNKLAVNGTIAVVSAQSINSNSTNLVFSVSGGSLSLSWPQDHTGWTLQAQTNAPGVGLGTNWVDVPGSSATNLIAIPINPANGAVFYRLKL